MTGERVYGPQASRMVGRLRGGGERSERAMTVLDLLRTLGPLSTEDVRVALGHANTSAVRRYLGELEAEGLAEIVTPSHSGPGVGRTATWAITEHGRTIA